MEEISVQDQRLVATAEILRDLHAIWAPHPSQQVILRDIFYGGKKNIYVECGRKFGKSETALYFLVRHALLHPKSANYYIAPLLKQAKEILWSTQRLQSFIPAKYIKAINNTELRVTLINDAFVKMDGSDNAESYRGITPDAICADEIAQHDKQFWIAMQPNRAVKDGPLLVIGTPPESENFATELKAQFMANDKRGAYFNFPSSANPHISHEWLEEEKARLIANGEEDVWEREYMARFVRNSRNAIFPMLDETRHVCQLEQIERKLCLDYHKLQWFCIADPGSTSVFAMLFGAINPFTRKLYLLHEIYETDQARTTTAMMLPRVDAIIGLYPEVARWSFVYDEAAAWFAGEARHYEPVRPWAPTAKIIMKRDKMTLEPWGLSIIKDALRQDKIIISDKCPKLLWEMQNYHRTWNRAGDIKILKRNDHLIDCLRYLIADANYSLPEFTEPPPVPNFSRGKRAWTLEEDLRAERSWAEPTT